MQITVLRPKAHAERRGAAHHTSWKRVGITAQRSDEAGHAKPSSGSCFPTPLEEQPMIQHDPGTPLPPFEIVRPSDISSFHLAVKLNGVACGAFPFVYPIAEFP